MTFYNIFRCPGSGEKLNVSTSAASESDSGSYHLLVIWPGFKLITSLSLSLLISKIGAGGVSSGL